jgi:uncharacterized membrane protein YecN with MAPEG domain
MTALQAAGLWSGLMILLLVVFGARVALGRTRHRVSLGDGGNDQMILLTRTFGNAAEYIPLGVGAMTLLALLGASALEIHLVGGAMMIGRLLHPLGLAMRAPNWARIAAMSLTWLALIGASVLLILAAFG